MTRVRPSKRFRNVALAITTLAMYLRLDGGAQAKLSVAFVSVVSRNPLTLGPPKPGLYGLSVTGAIPKDAHLRVYGLRPPEKALGLLLDESELMLQRRNVAVSGGPVLTLDDISTTGYVELFAMFTDAAGRPLGTEDRIVLDQAAALTEAPSPLRRALDSSSSLLSLLLRAYEQVRSDGRRRLFTASIVNDTMATPAPLTTAENILQIALCPDGRHVASIHRLGSRGQVELRVGDVVGGPRRMVSRAADIRTPIYAADHRLFFVQGRSLTVADQTLAVTIIDSPLSDVEGIFSIRPLERGVEMQVLGTPRDGIAIPLHTALAVSDAGATIARVLPDNSYYRGYSASHGDFGVVYAGKREAVSGIHLVTPEGAAKTLYECANPGDVAIAADGTRLAFTCGG